MNEQIERLRTAITKDEERIIALQQSVKLKKEHLKEKEAAVLQNSLSVIAARGGISVADIVEAIQKNNTELLLSLVDKEEVGRASDFPVPKSEKTEVKHL